MASTTVILQQLLQDFADNLHKNFDEMHQQLVNLNTRLHDIEQACIQGEAITSVQARLDREAAIDDLLRKQRTS